MSNDLVEREYRKTATIKAVQWWQMGDHPAVVLKAAPNRYADEGVPWIETLEGGHVVTPGDWIATGVNGEHWPIKPDIFAQTYEPVVAKPTKKFEREERYIVIKRKHLNEAQEDDIRDCIESHGIDTVGCVVVESDWPEYETVWKMIERRVTGAATMSDDLVERGYSMAKPWIEAGYEKLGTLLRELADEITRLRSLGGEGEPVQYSSADDEVNRAFIDGWNARRDHRSFDMALHYWMLSHAVPIDNSGAALSSKQVMDREAIALLREVFDLPKVLPRLPDDLYDRIDAILSLASPAVAEGWRPIETAPKDGSKIALLDNNVETAAIGEWMVDIEWRNAGKKPGESLAVPSWFPIANPTHWCPLPAPPAKGAGE